MKKIKLLLTVIIFSFLLNIRCYAEEVRVLSINGGDTSNDNTFLYSASMFYDYIENVYVNNIKVKATNCHYFKDPTYSQFNQLIGSSFYGAQNDDISILYYSGHGTLNETNGHAGIYTSDGDNYEFSTLYKKLKEIKGKKLVILDCCYSGAFITQNVIDKSKFTVLTACKYNSYSPFYNRISLLSIFNKKKVNMTRFSNTLLTGLGYFNGSLKADINNDKNVTIGEIYSYLQKKYEKTYSIISNGKKYLFAAIPLKYGNISFSFSKIPKKVVRIKLNKSSVSTYIGKTVTLKATVSGTKNKVSWSSSNSKIATVKNGKVTGKKAGTVKITAKVGGKTVTCTVIVKGITDKYAAYKKIISQYEKKYGKAQTGTLGIFYWQGLCFAKLLDFNGDRTKELVLAYQSEKTNINKVKYHVEMWTIDKKKAKKIVSGISWSGNNGPYFGGFSITKYKGKYLLELTDNAGWLEHYYGAKKDGTLGLIDKFVLKCKGEKPQWYRNGKAITQSKRMDYYQALNKNATNYSFSRPDAARTIKNEIAKTKKDLHMK